MDTQLADILKTAGLSILPDPRNPEHGFFYVHRAGRSGPYVSEDAALQAALRTLIDQAATHTEPTDDPTMLPLDSRTMSALDTAGVEIRRAPGRPGWMYVHACGLDGPPIRRLTRR